MPKNTIDRFVTFSEAKMPGIFRLSEKKTTSQEVYEDYAILNYKLFQSMDLNHFVSVAEDAYGVTMLYHHMRSRQTDFGQTVCLFQEPGTGMMYQLYAVTDTLGQVAGFDVKLFFSLERMMSEVRQELKRIATISGEFNYRLTDDEVVRRFL